jgi:hypothetical protein
MFKDQSGAWLKIFSFGLLALCSRVRWFIHIECLKTKNKNAMKGVKFVSAERFELSTNGLKGRCSAVELRAQHNSGLHSNMGNIHRQRKNLFSANIYQNGGSNG